MPGLPVKIPWLFRLFLTFRSRIAISIPADGLCRGLGTVVVIPNRLVGNQTPIAVLDKLQFTVSHQLTQLQTLHYDVLMAGFPCQAFSSVGLQHGFEDKTKGNATDIVLSLQADDLVLCYDGNTGNSKPLKWIFKGFVNSVGDTPLMTPGKYIVLESDKNSRKYLPESRWTKIVPYFGSSKSMDGRGLRRESKKRYDFFRSVLGMEDAEIPRTVDTSTVIVMSREEANELVGSISFRFDDTDIKLTDLVPVSYYTESNREYQYGVNLSKNEPVIKITGKVSVARKLLLKKGGNRHIGLVVCGEDLYHRSESELPELLDRKSIQYILLESRY